MDCMRMLNTKRLLSLFVGILMIGTVSLSTFNSSSSTRVSYADDGLDDIDADKIGKAMANGMTDGAVAGAVTGFMGGSTLGPAGTVAGAVGGAGIGAVAGGVAAGVTEFAKEVFTPSKEKK